ARPHETWAALSRRLTGRFANADVLRGGARGADADPQRSCEVPFALLRPELRRAAIAALLPEDRCEGSSWLHRPARGFAPAASPGALAAWFSNGSAGAAALELALGGPAPPGPVRIPCVGIAPWLSEARGCCAALSQAEEEDRAEAAAVEAA